MRNVSGSCGSPSLPGSARAAAAAVQHPNAAGTAAGSNAEPLASDRESAGRRHCNAPKAACT